MTNVLCCMHSAAGCPDRRHYTLRSSIAGSRRRPVLWQHSNLAEITDKHHGGVLVDRNVRVSRSRALPLPWEKVQRPTLQESSCLVSGENDTTVNDERRPDFRTKVVPAGGIEPPHPHGYRILNPARLPVPPGGRAPCQGASVPENG